MCKLFQNSDFMLSNACYIYKSHGGLTANIKLYFYHLTLTLTYNPKPQSEL